MAKLWAPRGLIAGFPFTLSELYILILWDKLLPASILVVPLGPNVLSLWVEGKITMAGKVLPLCPPGCPSWHPKATVCTGAVCASKRRVCPPSMGVDEGICQGLTSSVLYFGKMLLRAHSQAERMRDTERARDLFPSSNRVTENHQQSSCLSCSFIQTPKSPLQQITFQQGGLFCL